MTNKELDKIGFKMYVGLVNPDEGLDASGLLTDERFTDLLNSYYGRMYIPKIFLGNGDINEREKHELAKDARNKAIKDSREFNWATDDAIRGIRMRKSMANVPGEIIIAPVPLEALQNGKLKGEGPFEQAKLLLQMSTHILDRSNIRRIDQEEKEDLIDELNLSMKKRAKTAERKRKRREKND